MGTEKTVTGEIASVDANAKTITLRKPSSMDRSTSSQRPEGTTAQPGQRPEGTPGQRPEGTTAQPGQRPEGTTAQSGMTGQWPEGKTTLTLHVDASTKIAQKGASASPSTTNPSATANPSAAAGKNLELKDLKTGDKAMVKYVEKDGMLHAKSIEIQKSTTSSE
jgi:hypothetical protein